MSRCKKDRPLSFRMPESLKREIQSEADKNIRSFQDELVILLAQSIHMRKFSIKDYR